MARGTILESNSVVVDGSEADDYLRADLVPRGGEAEEEVENMPGLDRRILDAIDYEKVIERIKLDIRSDFIWAPHYNAIFAEAGEDLWMQLKKSLASGSYAPALPHVISVPKKSGFTRPGSILNPFDRFVYQALIDQMSEILEDNINRDRCFGGVLSDDPCRMFVPENESYAKFQNKVSELCEGSAYMIKADISNYFERIPQHSLVNLTSTAGCPREIVNLLQKMLSDFRERKSFGIIQGLYPSDVLGNFFLSGLDDFCENKGIPSARYVDDIYLSFESELEARKELSRLAEYLRADGLHLNELKTRILPSDDLVREETAVDRLFAKAVDEINQLRADEAPCNGDRSPGSFQYGFDADWGVQTDTDTECEDEKPVEVMQTERLFDQIAFYPDYEDGIEKFCLPLLESARSDIAVDHVCERILDKPHQAVLYFSYLYTFIRGSRELVGFLEGLLSSEKLISGYQKMFLLAVLSKAEKISRQKINVVLKWLQDKREDEAVRAVAAVLVSRLGTANPKKAVKLEYGNEPSEYVRGAILHAARFFTKEEKNVCKRAWGGHNRMNALIAKTI